MKLHEIVIAVLIVSVVAISIVSYTTSLGSNYGETADFSNLEQTQAAMDGVLNQTEELNQVTEVLLDEGGLLFVPYNLLKAGWSATKTMIASMDTIRVMIAEISSFAAEVLHIPDWVQGVIIAIMTILIIAMLIYAFFRWKFEN